MLNYSVAELRKKKSCSGNLLRICWSKTDFPQRLIPVIISISVVVSHSSSIVLGTVSCAIFLQYSCCSNISCFNNSFMFKHLIVCKDTIFYDKYQENPPFYSFWTSNFYYFYSFRMSSSKQNHSFRMSISWNWQGLDGW